MLFILISSSISHLSLSLSLLSQFLNELHHPVTSPLVGVFLTTILVFSALTIDYNNEFGKVLLWISCPVQWACMVFFV
jgi:tellurite resistance protein TehA-like permease